MLVITTEVSRRKHVATGVGAGRSNPLVVGVNHLDGTALLAVRPHRARAVRAGGAGDAKCWTCIAREGQETDDSTNGDEYRDQDDPGQQTWVDDDREGQGEGAANITALIANQRYSG